LGRSLQSSKLRKMQAKGKKAQANFGREGDKAKGEVLMVRGGRKRRAALEMMRSEKGETEGEGVILCLDVVKKKYWDYARTEGLKRAERQAKKSRTAEARGGSTPYCPLSSSRRSWGGGNRLGVWGDLGRASLRDNPGSQSVPPVSDGWRKHRVRVGIGQP